MTNKKPEEIEVKKAEMAEKKPAEQAVPVATTHPFEEMRRFFDNFWSGGFPVMWREFPTMWRNFPNLHQPRVDVVNRDNELVIRAEVPGVNKDDLHITLTDHSLTIKGETKHETKEEKDQYYRNEISYGMFTRTIPLPEEVDTERVKAAFKNGVLEVVAQKQEKAKPREVNVTEG